ncbi:hypothetical protein PPSIR1_14855 [Plesiocystis pacifica SIR-1]|uniref:Uncharacterized protein n=1 Tax=Plesiocystis pacifica SIR-1 TaxID=391625 RepID=A6GJM7_9BACT|nr:hypothetical protein [Plesiocystis pacifica]EDM73937.1 hypothetical protein PPSIR1_14855 [Plesiocystis pacifica SIR-1]
MGWLGKLAVVGALVAVGVVVVQRYGDYLAAERDRKDDAERAERYAAEDELSAVSTNCRAERWMSYSCVSRAELGDFQVREVADVLSKRWPRLRELGQSRISEGDRVGVVLEVGSSPGRKSRELLAGTVIAVDGDDLIVAPSCTPREHERHGLTCQSLALVPRRTVAGWAKPEDPEREGELEAWEGAARVRYVREGEPIQLSFGEATTRAWTIEPKGAAEVVELSRRDWATTISLRGARPGRLDCELYGDTELCKGISLGRWGFVVI